MSRRRNGARSRDPGPDRRRTLQELEQSDWGEPTYDSHLVRACHRLRRTPLAEFRVEDLRIMIGQGVGLYHLMPLALEHLEADPLSEGDLYPGDLLAAVARIGAPFWLSHYDYLERMRRVLSGVRGLLPSLAPAERETAEWVLAQAPECLTAS